MLQNQRLLRRLRRGNKDALRLVYEKYIDDLLRVAASLLYDIHAAEDCLHDVFVSFAGSVDDLATCRDIRKYLVTCVANRARDILRRKARRPDCQNEKVMLQQSSHNPANELIAAEEAARVFRSLTKLPYQQREVFVLHVQGGLKFGEIADLLGVSINTAQSRYRYAIRKLQQALKQGEQK